MLELQMLWICMEKTWGLDKLFIYIMTSIYNLMIMGPRVCEIADSLTSIYSGGGNSIPDKSASFCITIKINV